MTSHRLPGLFSGAMIAAIALNACGGGGGGGGTTPIPTPVPTTAPTPTPTFMTTGSAYTCPTSNSTTSIATGGLAGIESARRSPGRHGSGSYEPGLLAVTYDRSMTIAAPLSVASREQKLGASVVRAFDYERTGKALHVLSVNPANANAVMNSLRTQPGVLSVEATGERRFTTTVTTPYFPSDPYFDGFPSPTPTASPTNHFAPYYESASVPGLWDMHAIKMEYAFGYSQAGNGSGIVNANALGSHSVRLAIIDTGEDTGHPDLHANAVYTKCYITDGNGHQSSSNFTTDPTGHGTDTSGIAAAVVNNGLGFVGAGGNVALYAYRVFPTPDDNCNNPNTSDPQCGSSVVDIASAIDDAVTQNVNVISLSLGGGTCTSGVDEDPTEGAAITNALAHNVIVVAASGNSGGSPVTAPGCDTGVIAAGASALADGVTNGSGVSGGTANAPIEYVASYSQFGIPGKNFRNSGAWGIVAPGGDPGSNTDADDLHWIENIWTSTPFDSTFAGTCANDYPNGTLMTSPDCRVLIAGTSMSTPHVAGAAALVLAVSGVASSPYDSPAAMKTLLCATADEINDAHEGCGRLNTYRAVATAIGDPNLP